MRKNLLKIVSFACATSMLLAACSTSTTETSTQEQANAAAESTTVAQSTEAKPAGEIVVTAAMPSTWSDMFPLGEASHYDTIILNQVYDPLVSQKADGSFEGVLAESWTANEASDEIVFKLNKDAKWQDGSDFTAEDVVESFKMYSKKDIVAASRYYLQFIAGADDSGVELSEDSIEVKAVNEDEVSIKLKSATYVDTVLSNLSKVYILSAKQIKDLSVEDIHKAETWAKPMGTGAFIYESSVDGERMEFKANKDYFRGAPSMDKLIIRVVESANILPGLMQGEIDIVLYGGIPIADWALAKEQTNLKAESVPSANYQMIIMNGSKEYLTQEVRQAISMAINRKALVDNLLQGEGEAIISPISSISPYYDKTVDVWYDPDKAKSMLEAANFPFDQELSFYVPTGNEMRIKAATLVAEDLKAVGIKTAIQQVDFPKLMEVFDNGEEDIGIVGSGGSMNPAESLEMLKGNYNFSKLPDDNEMVKILEEANTSLTFELRQPLFNQFQAKVKEVSPYAYLFTNNNLVAYNTRLSNVNVADFATFNWSIHSWKVTQ